jgi:hypothetical protein
VLSSASLLEQDANYHLESQDDGVEEDESIPEDALESDDSFLQSDISDHSEPDSAVGTTGE